MVFVNVSNFIAVYQIVPWLSWSGTLANSPKYGIILVTMELTPEQFKKFSEWLNSLWKEPQKSLCPICKSNNWIIGDRISELREFHMGTLVVGGNLQPLITVMCDVCAYVMLFNALKLGLVPQPPKITDSSEPLDSSGKGV